MTDRDVSISAGKIVTLNFTLTDDDGDELDSTADGVPLIYLHGADNIAPGLEKQLTGKKAGDRIQAEVSPEEGYGERTGPGPQMVPLEYFPEDADLEPGIQFIAEDDDGNEVEMYVLGVEDEDVIVDQDHPLAGLTLHFDVEVLSVRDATPSELEHGHPHDDGDEAHGEAH